MLSIYEISKQYNVRVEILSWLFRDVPPSGKEVQHRKHVLSSSRRLKVNVWDEETVIRIMTDYRNRRSTRCVITFRSYFTLSLSHVQDALYVLGYQNTITWKSRIPSDLFEHVYDILSKQNIQKKSA